MTKLVFERIRMVQPKSLFYENLDKLKEILIKLAYNRDYPDKLKKEAQNNSLCFEPS